MKHVRRWYLRHPQFWHAFNAITGASLLALVTTTSIVYLGLLGLGQW